MKNIRYAAFTLIETMTTLMVSGIIFLGLFYVFTVLNNKFEEEFIHSELTDYCNYALDDIAESIRRAHDIAFSSQNIQELDQNTNVINNYTLDPLRGIIKNGSPIYMTSPQTKYNPTEKNGYMKYELERWEISSMDRIPEYSSNIFYSGAGARLKTTTIVIKLYAKLIMGWDADKPAEYLSYKRIVFSPGMYINS